MSIPLGNIHLAGKTPFPVIPMPIRITPKPEKNPVKQTQIKCVYHALHPGLCDLHYLLYKQTSFGLDKVIDFHFVFERTRVLTVLESLGWWDLAEFMVSGSAKWFTIQNSTTCGCPSEGWLLSNPCDIIELG